MKVYTLMRIQNASHVSEWIDAKVVYCSTSVTKAIEFAKSEYGIIIDSLSWVEIDEEENYGYILQEIYVNTRDKQGCQ